METKKEDADAKGKRYLKGNARAKRPRLCTKRLSKNKKWRLRRRMKKAACLALMQGTVMEAGTCADTSLETLPCTSATDGFLVDTICEGNVIYFKEEIIDDMCEADFHTDEAEYLEETDSEARWMNSAECRTVRQGTVAEAGTCGGTSLEIPPCTSAVDDFLADAICEGNVIYFKEEIIDDISEADFHMDEVENVEEIDYKTLVNQ